VINKLVTVVMFCFLLILSCCKKHRLVDPESTEEHLGEEYSCTWARDGAGHEVVCIGQGKRLLCVRHQCVVTHTTPTEQHAP
jgi:hypothetical protein